MNLAQIEQAVKEVMGKDPKEICISYYKGLIQISLERIAEEKKTINKLNKCIDELRSRND